MKPVCIVVPINKADFSSGEQLSLKHLKKYLGNYPIFLVTPSGLEANKKEFPIIELDGKYFNLQKNYNRLLTSAEFYKKFLDYEYILFYEPSALVFSDQLLSWCEKGYDYVAAAWPTGLGRLDKARDTLGNGGLCLIKVSAFLAAAEKAAAKRKNIFADMVKTGLDVKKLTTNPKAWLKQIVRGWRELKPYRNPEEDNYFSLLEAIKQYPEVKLAPTEQAQLFSFEVDPRFYLKRNGNQLPFGCAGWARWQKSFWTSYLLRE